MKTATMMLVALAVVVLAGLERAWAQGYGECKPVQFCCTPYGGFDSEGKEKCEAISGKCQALDPPHSAVDFDRLHSDNFPVNRCQSGTVGCTGNQNRPCCSSKFYWHDESGSSCGLIVCSLETFVSNHCTIAP